MKHISLFSGIGGFDLAAQWAGWENVAHCEIDPFCRKIISYYWPNAHSHEDIKTTDFSQYHGQIDILTGGFPCQPYSAAGKRRGSEDERHLWPYMLGAIRAIRPTWIVGENVRGLTNWSGGVVFEEVCADLEAEGYEVQSFILPAAGVGAPHQRERVWIVAYSEKNGNNRTPNESRRKAKRQDWQQVKQSFERGGIRPTPNAYYGRCKRRQRRSRICSKKVEESKQASEHSPSFKIGTTPNAYENNTRKHEGRFFRKFGGFGQGQKGRIREVRLASHAHKPRRKKSNTPAVSERKRFSSWISNATWAKFPTQPPICGGNDGLPSRLDGITFPSWRNKSIGAYGNAIVPQLAYQIFKAINSYICGSPNQQVYGRSEPH